MFKDDKKKPEEESQERVDAIQLPEPSVVNPAEQVVHEVPVASQV